MTEFYSSTDYESKLEATSFNFESDDVESRFENLINIDYLWRIVSSNNESKFYALRNNENTVSLYEMLNSKDKHESDYFLQFMFFTVLKKPENRKVKGRKSARLNIGKILQLANSDSIFLEKLERIKISINQKYNIANHWDMIYVERSYYLDDELIRLLGSCTDLFKPTINFECKKIV